MATIFQSLSATRSGCVCWLALNVRPFISQATVSPCVSCCHARSATKSSLKSAAGSGANDVAHNAQNPNSLLGKMLRIDVDVPHTDAEGFDIPADNPFVDDTPIAAHDAIWSFGLRNPWKFSFDPATGALIVADGGQSRWEEINYEPANRPARNYGWRNYEGSRANVQTLSLAYGPPTMPSFEYDHTEGGSISGGYVYRGSALDPALTDATSSRTSRPGASGRCASTSMRRAGKRPRGICGSIRRSWAVSAGLGLISGFGRDAAGELYVLSYTTGRVIKIVGTGGPFAAAPTPPSPNPI